jgi:formamidopyrimidine-DNA glycosylase
MFQVLTNLKSTNQLRYPYPPRPLTPSEPLEEGFTGDYLFLAGRGRVVAVKPFIMDSHVVAGVGNIYAMKPCSAPESILGEAIDLGGTTLRDFREGEGKPGYFALSLEVYGRGGEPCRRCGAAIQATRQGGRSTYFCGRCQR